MKSLYSVCGKEFFVSDEDYIPFLLCSWYYDKSNGYISESTSIYGKQERCHVIVARRIKLDLSQDIDHIDRNKLNNQRVNLRAASRSQNKGNQERLVGRYKGIYYHKINNKWISQIKVKGYTQNLGSFLTDKETALAYNEAALRYFGEFAYLNEV